ncbi:uncharacterized protein LOC143463206 [Clavelina lepadiformis]|uniref:uncharacterized protein LOC143463206 n=1 Tax=Clavelina lepadiformis TaxID=159417 RepID=UPI0040415BCA
MKKFKRFVCVKFNGGTNDVVPRSWLCDEGKLCKWPTNSSVDIAIMRKQEFPPQKNWKLFKCTVLCQSSLYEKCCRIAYTTQQCSTSELSSEPDEEYYENARSSLVRTNDERPGKPMQKTVAVNCGAANPNSSTTELLQELSKDIASRFDVISQQLHAIKSILDKPGLSQCGHQSTYQAPVLPKRSETMEELDKSLQDLHGIELIARKVDVQSLRATLRNFVRVFMTKSLASEFSWSGLGQKRRKIKNAFKDHKLYNVFLDTLHYTSHCKALHADIATAAKFVFNGVGDWEGGRAKRVAVDCSFDNVLPTKRAALESHISYVLSEEESCSSGQDEDTYL